MKNIGCFVLWIVLLVFGYTSSVYAIEPNLKYGKPSKEELSMDVYEKDTTASAVCLIREGKTYFTYKDGFTLSTEYWVRIKILKQEGVKYADVMIPYYAPDEKGKEQDVLLDLEGCAYNLENGKVTKSRLKKDIVSDERINQTYKVRKFSLPNVRKGTVIEYSYKVNSTYFSQIENWVMQEEIPVVHNKYEVTVPSVLVYNIEFRGKKYIHVDREEASITATSVLESGPSRVARNFGIKAERYILSAHDLPALAQDEPYCWCPEDYRVQASFDLQGTNYPDEGYKALSKNWTDVDKLLLSDEHLGFGRWLRMPNPFIDETRSAVEKLQQEKGDALDFDTKVRAAFDLLKEKLAWNGKYDLYCDNMDKVVKNKSGNNAELNFVFISILRGFGINAYPVVISRRSMGMLPVNFPTYQKLNTFVVAVYDTKKQRFVYLDSSMTLPVFNVLPCELLVEKGRLLAPNVPEEKRWVDLMQVAKNLLTVRTTAEVVEGSIKGHRQVTMQGQYGLEYRWKKQRGEAVPWLDDGHVVLSNVEVREPETRFGALLEEADYEMKLEQAGDMLYVNPMIFPQLRESPFVQTKRELPVEFDYPYQISLTCELKLPEGYQVEEMPQPGRVTTEDNKLQFTYWISREEGTVYLKYEFAVKAHLFPADYYSQLQEMWDKAVEKNNALIVLKKQQ